MASVKVKAVTQSILGQNEPKWNGIVAPEDIDYIKALNWYAANSDIKESQKWFQQWVKKQKFPKTEEVKILKYDISKFGPVGRTLGFFCRMLLNGLMTLPESTQSKLNNMIKEAKSSYEKTQEVSANTSVDTPNIQDRIRTQVMSLAGELEGHFDNYIDSVLEEKEYKFDFYKWLKENGVKPLIAKKIADNLRDETIFDFEILVNGQPDDDLKEGYAFLKKSQIKKVYNFIHKAIDDCEKWAAVNSKSRSPRKKKPVSVEKLVAKVKYKKQDDTYKIGSISPDKIIGAQQLWVFNTKTRKLGVYQSSEPEGFTIKGTTILNFDEKTSVQKTLRKPKEYLDKVSNSGKVALKKIMSEIKAVESALTGRINGDTILLRVL